MSLKFTNPKDLSSASTDPSVEVLTLDEMPDYIKDEVAALGAAGDLVTSVNGKTGDVTIEAEDIEFPPIPGFPPGITIEDIITNIGSDSVYSVQFKQVTGEPAKLEVVSHYLNGDPASTVLTTFAGAGRVAISYNATTKTLTFNGTGTQLYAGTVSGTPVIPEPGELYVYNVTPPVTMVVNDLVLLHNDATQPIIFGVVRELNYSNVVLNVVGSAYKYSSVKAYATRAAFPTPADAQERVFYVASDTGMMYAFINGGYSALNDGGILSFPTVSAFPSPGDYHYLYLDASQNDIYSYLGSYKLLNDGGVIETSSVRPRPTIGNPRFLYIDTDNGHIYAWIVDRYVLLNEGGIIFVDIFSDLPVAPAEKFLYAVRTTGNVYAWIQNQWLLLNDGGVKVVNTLSPRPSTGDTRFLYADSDTGLVYAWVNGAYETLNDGGIKLYPNRASFPAIGTYRYLYIDQASNDIYAYLGIEYKLLNDGGIRRVNVPAELPATPDNRYLYQVISSGDIYAYIGSQWVLLNDGGTITVADYASLPAAPNTRFMYVTTDTAKAYISVGGQWHGLNREGGLYIGTFNTPGALPPDRGELGDWAFVKKDDSGNLAVYTVTNVTLGARTWKKDASFEDAMGPKFLGYYYTEAALTNAVYSNPTLYRPGDFAILLDNNQANPTVPVQHLPPNAANKAYIYILLTVTPSITWDNQVYLDSRGTYKGTFANVASLPINIMFDNAGAKKGDWVIVLDNGAGRAGIYAITDFNVLAPSITWSPGFVFPVTDVYDGLDSDSTTMALSAKQGKALATQIQDLEMPVHVRGTVINTFASQGSNYSVTAFAIATAGSGYEVGDALIVSKADVILDAIIVVSAVDGGGGITAGTVSKGGAFAAAFSTSIAPAGGSGTGAAVNLTTVSAPNTTLNSIVNPAMNDVGIVLEDEVHSLTSWEYIYADYNGDGIFNWVPLAPYDTDTQRDFYVSPILADELGTGSVIKAKLASGAITRAKFDNTENMFGSGNKAWTALQQFQSGSYLGNFATDAARDLVYPNLSTMYSGNWVSVEASEANGGQPASYYIDVTLNKWVKIPADTGGGSVSGSGFTFVVNNDQDMADWVANKPGNDYTSVLVAAHVHYYNSYLSIGTGSSMRVPTKYIKGIPGKSSINQHDSQYYGVFINQYPDDDYSLLIEDLMIRRYIEARPSSTEISVIQGIGHGDTDRSYKPVPENMIEGMKNCTCELIYNVPEAPSGNLTLMIYRACSNLSNCKAVYRNLQANTYAVSIVGFYSCDFLDGCWVYSTESVYWNGGTPGGFIGFRYCRYLVNCKFYYTLSSPTAFVQAYGYISCYSVVDSISVMSLSNIGAVKQVYGFSSSNKLVNCISKILLSGMSGNLESNIIGFTSCNAVSHCSTEFNVYGVTSGTVAKFRHFSSCHYMLYNNVNANFGDYPSSLILYLGCYVSIGNNIAIPEAGADTAAGGFNVGVSNLEPSR
jgi:hypothetical protein